MSSPIQNITLRLSRVLSAAFLVTMMALRTVEAQGFMVEPMRMDLKAAAGNVFQVPLSIRNTGGESAQAVQVSLVELSQHSNGGWAWRPVSTEAEAVSHQSSLAWTSIDQSNVEIEPLAPAEVLLRFEPPRNARGAYFAALLVETPIPEGSTGVVVRTRFLIPIIVEIEGRPVRQNVLLEDVSMSYDQADGRDPTTNTLLRITNAGETLSRVTANVRVERRNGDNWRVVTQFEMRERSIIPGITLDLAQDLERRLPSGEYRLSGEVQVDGRRLPPLLKEISFVGDPTVDVVAYDTELRLTPEMVQMDIVPGATRTTILRIENPGADAVTVDLGAATPRGLLGVRLGDLVGAELSAEPWTKVQPSQFTLRGGASQNVRVVSTIPADAELHANYYADLVLSGTYVDGQGAGNKSSVIHLVNQAMPIARQGLIEAFSLAESAPDVFAVQVRFVNTGNAHVEPLARAVLTTPQGQTVRSAVLTGAAGMLLPLGQRMFGGEVDFSDVAPGIYGLRLIVDLDDGESIVLQRVLEVSREEVQTADGVMTPQTRIAVMEGSDLPEMDLVPDDEAGD